MVGVVAAVVVVAAGASHLASESGIVGSGEGQIGIFAVRERVVDFA